MMTDVKKFLFDTHDFTQLQKPDEETYTREQLLLAKDQSFAAGKAEGVKEAKALQEAHIAALLQKAADLAGKMAQNEDRREAEKCVDAAKLALKVAHKLLPQFSVQYALPEIERAIIQSMEARKDEPRIAVTIPPAHLDALKARIDALAIEKGFAGKVILLADDTLPPTDCRIEWTDGGAERLYERLLSQIENEFAKAVSSVQQNKEQP